MSENQGELTHDYDAYVTTSLHEMISSTLVRRFDLEGNRRLIPFLEISPPKYSRIVQKQELTSVLNQKTTESFFFVHAARLSHLAQMRLCGDFIQSLIKMKLMT